MLEIGTKAPAFSLPDQNGEMRSLCKMILQIEDVFDLDQRGS